MGMQVRDMMDDAIRAIERTQLLAVQSEMKRRVEAGMTPQGAALDILRLLNAIQATFKAADRFGRGAQVELTDQQIAIAEAALGELQSPDPTVKRKFLTRTIRPRSYDNIVEASAAYGAPIAPDIIDKIMSRCRAALMEHRRQDVARFTVLAEIAGTAHSCRAESQKDAA